MNNIFFSVYKDNRLFIKMKIITYDYIIRSYNYMIIICDYKIITFD